MSGIQAGAGLFVSVNSDGIATAELEEFANLYRYPDRINLNNAMHITDGDLILLSFPESRASSMVGVIPVGRLSSAVTYQATVFAEIMGLLSGGSWPAITVTMTFLASAEAGAVAVGSAPTLATSIASFSSSQYVKYHKEAAAALAVSSNGTLYVKLAVASGAKNKNILGFGVVVRPVTS